MKIWRQFKAFALSGSMLDLALGFLIGTAFAAVIDSITNNVLMPSIAAAFGRASFSSLLFTINGVQIHYGQLLTDVLNFVIFAATLFLFLKFIGTVGLGRVRQFEEKQCPYCMEYVDPRSLVCKVCRHSLVATLPDLDIAEARAAQLRERRRLNLPDIELPEFEAALAKVRHRAATAATAATAAAATAAAKSRAATTAAATAAATAAKSRAATRTARSRVGSSPGSSIPPAEQVE